MGLTKPLGNQASDFNSVYNITLDTANYDRTTIQVIAPVSGALSVYASLDGGAGSTTQGNAASAQNFSAVLATNLATGTASNIISTPGLYTVTDNAQFLKVQGNPAGAGTSVYKLFITQFKED